MEKVFMKKKLLKSLLVASLVLGTATSTVNVSTVFAAGSGTITVQDTKQSETYTAYKVFDAVVANEQAPQENKDGVSYLIPSGKESVYSSSANFSTLFDTITNGGRTYVVKKEVASATDIAAWAKAITATAGLTSSGSAITENDTDGTVSFTNLDYGYYYVSTTLNQSSVVMVTSVTPNATIHEKNSTADWGDGGGKTVDAKSYSVGDTVTYKITYKNAVNYDGATKVYQYVLKDDMPDASVVDLNEKSYKVTVTNAAGETTTLTEGSEKQSGKYSVVETGNDFDITIPWAATNTQTENNQNGAVDDFFYKGVNTITVEYTGVLKSAAKPGTGEIAENTNKATINPNTQTDDGGKKVSVNDGQITIKKVDGQTNANLEGAVFVLKNSDSQFLNFSNTNDVEWGTEAQATEYKTSADGTISITGLKAGTYYLVEKVAPKGYNLLKDPQEVKLGDGATDTTNSDTLLVSPTVKNNKGTELPSTGGMGTKLFYMVGASMALLAGIVLVARRRLHS